MISTKKMLEIVTEVLELHTGKVDITLDHNLQDDLLINKDEHRKINNNLVIAFQKVDCDIELYDIHLWKTVECVCKCVADSLDEHGYIIYQNIELL